MGFIRVERKELGRGGIHLKIGEGKWESFAAESRWKGGGEVPWLCTAVTCHSFVAQRRGAS